MADADDFANLTEDDVEPADDEEDDSDLTDDQKAERKAEKQQQQFTTMADEALNRWHQGADEATRVATIDSYVETGNLDHEAAGVDELEVQVVEAAFTGHIERNVLREVGLTMDQWQEHIDEADLPAFRRAVVEGDWQALKQHARAAAKMRLDLGL